MAVGRRLALLASAMTLACGSPEGVTTPTVGPADFQRGGRIGSNSGSGGDLHFFSAPSAPPFAATTVSFWAVKGQDRRASIYYRKAPNRPDSTEFVRFRVRSRSLLARPDGTPFANGDSVLITLTVADPANLIVDFQPAGLRFSPTRPAELEFRMDECDLDLNHDGVVDLADQLLLASGQIYRQETPSDPWIAVPTLAVGTDFVGRIDGFTRYLVAY